MSLEDKNVVIYGAGGSIGSAVARVFAREGATVHLTGRTRETLDAVAESIVKAGGAAEVAVVDALDERTVEEHADAMGRIDVSLNLVPRGDVQGIPLTDMTVADFTRAVNAGVTTNFITARAAARRMTAQGSGVILALNSGSAHGSPMMGSTGPADAATDTFIRNLAMEVGPAGVRVLGLWVAGILETLTLEKLSAVNAGIDEAALQGIRQNLDQMRMLRRSPRLSEIAETIAFLASDHARGMTGTFVNVTGMFTS